MFATSVMENIRYGKPEASDVEVYEAATKVTVLRATRAALLS